MFGTNKRISLIKTTRVVANTGVVGEELETVIASNIPAAIQANILSNLPPPPDRQVEAGRHYLREFRCWIPTKALGTLVPRTQWLLQDDVTGEKFRIHAVVDDAGRGHHWLLRCTNYQS